MSTFVSTDDLFKAANKDDIPADGARVAANSRKQVAKTSCMIARSSGQMRSRTQECALTRDNLALSARSPGPPLITDVSRAHHQQGPLLRPTLERKAQCFLQRKPSNQSRQTQRCVVRRVIVRYWRSGMSSVADVRRRAGDRRGALDTGVISANRTAQLFALNLFLLRSNANSQLVQRVVAVLVVFFRSMVSRQSTWNLARPQNK